MRSPHVTPEYEHAVDTVKNIQDHNEKENTWKEKGKKVLIKLLLLISCINSLLFPGIWEPHIINVLSE